MPQGNNLDRISLDLHRDAFSWPVVLASRGIQPLIGHEPKFWRLAVPVNYLKLGGSIILAVTNRRGHGPHGDTMTEISWPAQKEYRFHVINHGMMLRVAFN